jgi:tetratricopeptide (TPR) repeat protein
MAPSTRAVLAVLLLAPALVPVPAAAQPPLEDAPAVVSRGPRTRQALDRLEARKLYALALLRLRDNRLADGARLLEQAARLDPAAAPPVKSLAPVYLALDRTADALAACGKALELDPGDYETWYLYARMLKGQGRAEEWLEALGRAFACPGLKDSPEIHLQVAFELGLACEELQDYGRALDVFAEIVRSLDDDPDDAKATEAYVCLGRVCFKARHFNRAVAAYQKAQRLLQPRDAVRAQRLNYDLAQVYQARGDVDEALRRLEAYLRTQPPATEPYELYVALLRQAGRDDEVLKDLTGFADRDAHNVALKLLLARECARAGRPGRAEELYLQLAAESPAPDVYRGLFSLYRAQRRLGDVLDLFDQAVAAAGRGDGEAGAATRARFMLAVLRDDRDLARDLLPVGRERVRTQQRLQPQTRRLLAVLATRTHQLDAAEEFYRDCLASAVNSQTGEGEDGIYAGLLQILWEAHKHEAVIEVCRKGLREAKATNRMLFHYNLARALVATGKGDEALAEADKAVQLADDDSRLNFRLFRVDVLRLAGRFKQAESDCLALLKEVSKPAEVRDVRYTLSNVYSAARDLRKSEGQLRLILQDDPDDATANNDLGYLLADQGKGLDEAERLIRKALALDAKQKQTGTHVEAEDDQPNAAYVDSLGWVLFRRGRLEDARREMEKAVALPEGARDPVVWDHLGDVYFRLDQPGRARTAWQKAVTLYETERRRQLDDQYREIKHKLESVQPQGTR